MVVSRIQGFLSFTSATVVFVLSLGFSLGCKMAAAVIDNTARQDNVQRKRRDQLFFCVFFFFLKRNAFPQFSSSHLIGWNYNHTTIQTNVCQGEWVHNPLLGLELAGSTGTNSIFLPQAASTLNFWLKSFTKKNILFPPSSCSTEGLNFKRINDFLCIDSFKYWKHSQWAHLHGLGVSYGARRAVQGCWRLIAQCTRVIMFNHSIFSPLL